MKNSQNYNQKMKKVNRLYWIAVSISALAFPIASLVMGEENGFSVGAWICVFSIVVDKANGIGDASETDDSENLPRNLHPRALRAGISINNDMCIETRDVLFEITKELKKDKPDFERLDELIYLIGA